MEEDMHTLKDYYEMIINDNTKDYDGPISCATCKKTLTGDFTLLPDYDVEFCKVENNAECFEQWCLGEITSHADMVFDQMKEDLFNAKNS